MGRAEIGYSSKCTNTVSTTFPSLNRNFSKTMTNIESKSTNVSIINDNILEEVTKMKEQPGKNIVLYGGAGIVQSLAKLDLIDEYRLVLNPVVLGSGTPLFKNDKFKLKLLKTEMTKIGCVILYYEPDRKEQ